MNAQTARIFLQAGILISPLALVACGGGDGPAVCSNPNPAVCAVVGSASRSTTSPPSSVALFTTAPTQVTLNAGTSVTYGAGGGSPPYTATSGNANVVTAGMSGNTLSLTSVAEGSTDVAVVDSLGKTVNIVLKALAKGEPGKAISISPAQISVGSCTTNIPFIFTGGDKPYTVFSTDNFNVPVSAALELDRAVGSYYFTASTLSSKGATLTVLDAQSRTATVVVNTSGTGPCPENPLLKVIPESANFRASEIRSFQVTGGPPQSKSEQTPTKDPLTVYFFDTPSVPPVPFEPPVATYIRTTPVTASSALSFNVQAVNSVTTPRTTLMTVVTADNQRTNVVIRVLPQPLNGQSSNVTLTVLP